MVRATVAAMKMLGALMCVVLVFTAGCSEDKKPEAAPTTIATTVAPTTTIDPARLASLLDAAKPLEELQVKLKSPLKYRSVIVGIDYILVQVVQPKNPKNLDSYRYARRDPKTTAEKVAAETGQGKALPFEWGPPVPVKMDQRDVDNLPLLVFSPGEVAWAKIPTLAKQALTVLEEIESPRVDVASVVKNSNGELIYIQIPVDGTRGSGLLRADGRGTVLQAARN